MLNSTPNRRTHTFFKDAFPVALGLTLAMALLDLFIKWLSRLNYENYKDLTSADGWDIGISSIFIFATLSIVLLLKNRFSLPQNELASLSNVIRNAVLAIVPTGVVFLLETFLKLITDIHGDKNNNLHISRREWNDIGETSGLLLLGLVVSLIIKDICRVCRSRTIEEYPAHVVIPTENTTINVSASTQYRAL